MAEEIISDIPEEILSIVNPEPVAFSGVDTHPQEQEEDNPSDILERTISRASNVSTQPSTTSSSSSAGIPFGKLLSFAGSCSINLILPFINGLMLGFGELIAHEISWKFKLFGRDNKGYKIFPQKRLTEGRLEEQQKRESREERSDGFL